MIDVDQDGYGDAFPSASIYPAQIVMIQMLSFIQALLKLRMMASIKLRWF